MTTKINYRYINTSFSKANGENYDGHLTIHFRWGGFYPKGNNPLAHKELDQLVKEIKPILIERSLGSSVVNCNWGEWKDITFQYVKKENLIEIFNIATDLFNKITSNKTK